MNTTVQFINKQEIRNLSFKLTIYVNLFILFLEFLLFKDSKIAVIISTFILVSVFFNALLYQFLRKIASGQLVQDLIIFSHLTKQTPILVKLTWIKQVKSVCFFGLRFMRFHYGYDGKKHTSFMIGVKRDEQTKIIDLIGRIQQVA